MRTPDEFYDVVRERLAMSFNESAKASDALTYAEGTKLVRNLALAATAVYRLEWQQITPQGD